MIVRAMQLRCSLGMAISLQASPTDLREARSHTCHNATRVSRKAVQAASTAAG
jgi:hypothetical protein